MLRALVEQGKTLVEATSAVLLCPQRLINVRVPKGYDWKTSVAIRTAQAKYGKKPLTGEQMRWGIENLQISEARLKELGATGFMQPLKVSCMDHEGGGSVKFLQWDGTQWKVITDWITPDRELVRGMVEESAARYAKEKNITPRDCTKDSAV